MPLKLEIVTPEKKMFSDEVDSVVLPGIDGELGVLPNHAPLVTMLKPGELSYTKGGETIYLAVGEGFVEVLPTSVAVMTDMAVGESEIDEAAVEEALAARQDALELERPTRKSPPSRPRSRSRSPSSTSSAAAAGCSLREFAGRRLQACVEQTGQEGSDPPGWGESFVDSLAPSHDQLDSAHRPLCAVPRRLRPAQETRGVGECRASGFVLRRCGSSLGLVTIRDLLGARARSGSQ